MGVNSDFFKEDLSKMFAKNYRKKLTGLQQDYEQFVQYTLQFMYPGYLWSAEYNPHRDCCEVINFDLSMTHGFYIPCDKVKTMDEVQKYIREHGGQLLERFGMPRGGKISTIQELIDSAERDVRGNMKNGDLSNKAQNGVKL